MDHESIHTLYHVSKLNNNSSLQLVSQPKYNALMFAIRSERYMYLIIGSRKVKMKPSPMKRYGN